MRSVKFPIVKVGGVLKSVNWTKVSRLLAHNRDGCIDAQLQLNLTKFVQEVANGSKDPYPPKMLYQIVCDICRFIVPC